MRTLRSVLALSCCALAFACSPPPRDASTHAGQPGRTRVSLDVYAATSTRDALQALEAAYEHEHQVELVFNFGASSDLSKQIVAAAKADVFLSADELEMDVLEKEGLVATGTRRALLSNQLVVVEPAGGTSLFTKPFAPTQLADERVKRVSLGDVATVPAGRYAKAWLESTGAWQAIEARVLPAIDARAALAAVESGGAQAGIVYRTDAARSTKARAVFAVPFAQGPPISYPVAAIAGRPEEARARAFVAFLGTNAALDVFEAHGFVPVRDAATGAK